MSERCEGKCKEYLKALLKIVGHALKPFAEAYEGGIFEDTNLNPDTIIYYDPINHRQLKVSDFMTAKAAYDFYKDEEQKTEGEFDRDKENKA